MFYYRQTDRMAGRQTGRQTDSDRETVIDRDREFSSKPTGLCLLLRERDRDRDRERERERD